METKSTKINISSNKFQEELLKNLNILTTKYSHIIGIMYNGLETRVFKFNYGGGDFKECNQTAKTLQHKNYYIRLYTENQINKQQIYNFTKKINDLLHSEFGMIDLEDRMVFTACALVSQRFNPINGLKNFIDMDFSTMHNWIYSSIAKAIKHDKKYNLKLDTLLEEFSKIRIANSKNQNAINNFINYVCEIADLVNSDYWNGEDVMGIFFNEFNRYKGKSEAGQVLHQTILLL